ncbi:MAG: methyltransferase domain-containing protein [Betaproteobacteria bacterium]|nr:methyltransferase domain-containing protein [Betaproteobacteria bacterium]
MGWDPAQYLKFADERLRPALDLLQRIPAAAPETVVDLGCGAGNLAPLLLQRWPQAKLIGVDSSPEMLARARADHPGATFEQSDVASWRPPRPVDVLYSNAALHWLDHHERLFPALLQAVKPGGWLAAQMPRNFGAPSHATIVQTIEQGPWRAQLEPLVRRRPTEEPQFYWKVLSGGTCALDIWECEYLQAMQGENPVAEFTKGSWLKQFLDRLQEPQRGAFEADYRRRVAAAYPKQADGRTLFPFRRLFIVAQRAGGPGA